MLREPAVCWTDYSDCHGWLCCCKAQTSDNVRVRNVLTVATICEVGLGWVANLGPLLCQVLGSLVEVAITGVVKDACLQPEAVRVLDRCKRKPLAAIALPP